MINVFLGDTGTGVCDKEFDLGSVVENLIAVCDATHRGVLQGVAD